MFGGKVMGVPEGDIGKIMGKTAADVFNFNGSTTKFFYMIKVIGYRSGTFTDNSGERNYSVPKGHMTWRKKNSTYNPGSTAEPAGRIFEGTVNSSGYANAEYYVVDCYGIVTPARTVTYEQWSSSEVSQTASAYHKGIIDLYLP